MVGRIPSQEEKEEVSPKTILKAMIRKKCSELIKQIKLGDVVNFGGVEVEVVATFTESDGSMSDLYLCQLVQKGAKNKEKENHFLIKQLKIINSTIQEQIRSLNRSEKLTLLKDGPKILSSIIAARIMQTYPAILKREGMIASRVHPKGGFALSEDNTRLLMPLFSGEKLFSVHNKAFISGLDFEKRIRLLSKIVDAVNHMHQMQIGHFDLKPENILFDPETGLINLVDFGTSHILEHSEQILPERLGTPAYISPEARHSGIGLKTDGYVVGQLMLETLFTHILPKEEKISLELNELRELVKAFGYRLQGKNSDGLPSLEEEELQRSMAIDVQESSYFKTIYLRFRPHPGELKQFFNWVGKYLDEMNKGISADQAKLAALKAKLNGLAHPDIEFHVAPVEKKAEDKEARVDNEQKLAMRNSKLTIIIPSRMPFVDSPLPSSRDSSTPLLTPDTLSGGDASTPLLTSNTPSGEDNHMPPVAPRKSSKNQVRTFDRSSSGGPTGARQQSQRSGPESGDSAPAPRRNKPKSP